MSNKLLKPPSLPTFGSQPWLRQQGTLSPQRFEEQLKGQGIKMRMARAAPCPNVKDVQGTSHPPDCELCVNGYRYYGEQRFTGAFLNNNNTISFEVQGSVLSDIAQVIVPTADLDGRPIDANFFDVIKVENSQARYWQRVEASQSGIDKLRFPANQVEILYDAEREYVPGVDFVVNPAGRIEWRSNNRPGFDVVLGHGSIYGIVFYAAPIFTILQIPVYIQEIPTQGPDGPGTPNVMARLPYVVTVRREFIAESSKQDMKLPEPAQEPRDSGF